MRFVAAIVSFVVAFCLIGLGIAQRTVFAEPDRVTSEVAMDSDAPITIIDGKALNARDGRQRIVIDARPGTEAFAAYGRTSDLVAWAGDTSYNRVSFDVETQELVSELKRGSSSEAPSPVGSDLWISEYANDRAQEFTVNVPANVSLIILADGATPAPPTVSVTWPVDNRAPWSGPLIVGGALVLMLGLGLYLWALLHLRRMRGPRRKPPTQPKMPRKPRYNYRKATKAVRGAKPKEIANPRGRRSAGKLIAVVPTILVSALVLSGCSASDWPDFVTGATTVEAPAPTASAAAAAEEGEIEQTPAVTISQLESIMARISAVAEKADADKDVELAKTRFTGAALQLRQANYAIRKVDNSIDPLPPIPAEPIELTLPQQSDIWPRVVFTVIQEPNAAVPTHTGATAPTEGAAADTAETEDEPVIPTALMLVQETPRDNYKIAYSVTLEASVSFPEVASAELGAVRQGPENKLLMLPPGELAAAYSSVMLEGEKSEFHELFNFEADALIPAVGVAAKAARAKKLSTTKLAYSSVPGVGEPIAIATSDAGAIVAVTVGEVESAKPKEKGAILSPAAGTKALSKITKTTKGVAATYAYQLLFYVPPTTSDELIVLLGFSEGLVAAKEL